MQEALASAAEQMDAFKNQLESSHKEWCEQVMSKRDTEKELQSHTYTRVSFSSRALFFHSNTRLFVVLYDAHSLLRLYNMTRRSILWSGSLKRHAWHVMKCRQGSKALHKRWNLRTERRYNFVRLLIKYFQMCEKSRPR